MNTKVTHRRPRNSRKKWVTVSARFINGETEELARFRAKYQGDANIYVARLRQGDTVEEIFID